MKPFRTTARNRSRPPLKTAQDRIKTLLMATSRTHRYPHRTAEIRRAVPMESTALERRNWPHRTARSRRTIAQDPTRCVCPETWSERRVGGGMPRFEPQMPAARNRSLPPQGHAQTRHERRFKLTTRDRTNLPRETVQTGNERPFEFVARDRSNSLPQRPDGGGRWPFGTTETHRDGPYGAATRNR